jgi:uroporphyrinogen decarboxylase
MDMWATPEVRRILRGHLGVSSDQDLYRHLHIDRPLDLNPAYIGPPLEADTDMFGVRYKMVDYGTGVYEEPVTGPLEGLATIEEIEDRYSWPSADWLDYGSLERKLEGQEDRPVQFTVSGIYTLYTRLRGMEQAFLDFAVNQEMVEHVLTRLADYCYERAQRIYETLPGRVDVSWIYNDLGSQEDLMCSPQTVRRLFIPYITRLARLIREAGSRVALHSDGAIGKAIPDLLDAGIQMINPVQWRCPGMEREGLKDRFGDRVVFHGAMDNQQTLVRSTPQEVRAEVRDNMDLLGSGGGYILAPCHNLQPVSPPELILAMYQEGYEYGRL